MYFWRVAALIEDLKHNRVSERQKMIYFAASTLYGLFLTYLYMFAPRPFTPVLLLEIALVFVIVVLGVYFCYSANKDGDDKNFIERMVCLSWPITIRMFVILIPIQLIYMAYLSETQTKYSDPLFEALLAVVYCTYYYKWLHSCIAEVARTDATAPVLPVS